MAYGWHFTGATLRDGSPLPEIGEWEQYNGLCVMCKSGLHVGKTPWDALRYAPGENLRYVEYADVQGEHTDKILCRRRRTVVQMDATEMLRYFARMRALSVVHLWEAPEVVLDYLMTGDEQIRAAARDAAWAAAGAAARDAAGAAAWDAAWDAAWAAAWDAARSAAWAAAGDAAWDAATAAGDAAGDEFNALVYECFESVLVSKEE